jgi:NitT/TauT family transport system permease protein
VQPKSFNHKLFRFWSKPPVVIVLFGLLVIWEICVFLFQPSPLFLPAPSSLVAEFFLTPSLFLYNAWLTLINTLLGFALSVVIGISLAIAIVYSRLLESTIYTALVAMNNVPKVALAPLFVIWLGTGDKSKIGMAFMIAIFAVVISAVLGLRSVDPDVLDLGRSMKGSGPKMLMKIRFPNALPSIFAGMKVAIALALVGAIVGEFVAAQHGLGYVILAAQGVFETKRVFVALLLLAIMGTVLFYLIELIEKKMIPWHVSQRSSFGRNE